MRRPALLSVASLSAACLAAPARADLLCVRPGGAGGCLATIGAALAAAGPGDVIRVAAGTYTENPTIDENVTVEGGWNAAFTSWNPAANLTTIQPADPQLSVVAIEGNVGNPSASTPVFAGFTVTGGRADLGGNHGGGMRIRDSHATVRDSVVTGNRAALFGGGIWVQRGTPRFERVRVEGNVVVGDGALGGGIDLEGTAGTVEIVDAVIRGNAIDGADGRGGGLFADGDVSIRGSGLEDNSAGPSCSGTGGAIQMDEGEGLEVRSTRLIGNCAADHDHVVAYDAYFYGSLFVSRPTSTAAAMLRMGSASLGRGSASTTWCSTAPATPSRLRPSRARCT